VAALEDVGLRDGALKAWVISPARTDPARDLRQCSTIRGARFSAPRGLGSQRIVPYLDWTGLRRAHKLVVGYSDATALLVAVLRATGTAIHGPMVADDLARGLAAPARERLRRLLGDPTYLWHDEVPVCVRPGAGEGRLIGGCLSVLAATLGTAHAPDTRGAACP
jgi:muramoyltetrapeptide carboxypeptidase